MSDAFIVGIHSTRAGRLDDSVYELARQAVMGALQDARIDGDVVGHIYFSNAYLEFWGQRMCKGQVCTAPLVADKVLPPSVPVTNVEGACASGTLAVNAAMTTVLSGRADVAIAVGVEKMWDPTRPGEIFNYVGKSADQMNPERGLEFYKRVAADEGVRFAPAPGHSFAMDVYALLAATHMQHYGTTARQMAAAAAKNHTNAVDNPRAQYRFPMDVDAVLADRTVTAPLTRAMCAPIGDGGAAAIVCSSAFLAALPSGVRARAVRIRGQALAGARMDGSWESDRAPVVAARRAYAEAGIQPKAVDIVELHDATSFAEIHLVEDLGLCSRGQGGPFTESGATRRDGDTPVNVSGGLVSKGHPVGATGIMMLYELCLQLRGEAAELQVPNVRLGLAENGGGMAGRDLAITAVTILEGPA